MVIKFMEASDRGDTGGSSKVKDEARYFSLDESIWTLNNCDEEVTRSSTPVKLVYLILLLTANAVKFENC